MKGLELSEQYYYEVVKPMLTERFPALNNRYAAGLVGEGSQCLGYDDEISRDHEWGASVCIWLERKDYEVFAQEVHNALMSLPREYKGYPVSFVPGRNGVLEIGAFYQKYLAIPEAPKTIGQWLNVPAHHLATASNGKVFEDPLGTFSAIRKELLLGYPEDIRKKRLASSLMKVAQSGQYNYPRIMSRGDKIAASLTENEFITEAIQVVYLLNNRYTPFYKWMAHGMQDLPILGKAVYEKLSQISAYPNPNQAEEDYYVGKINRMQEICALIAEELKREGLSTSEDPFLVAHGLEVHKRIAHEGLRNTNPWS